MSQRPYKAEELFTNLKTLIKKEEASAPLTLVSQANEQCDYRSLLVACFEPIRTEGCFLYKSAPKSFFDLMPSHLSLEHAHLGYLLYLAKKHDITINNLPDNKFPETFTDENLENWCHDYYQALQRKMTVSEKLYLAKLLPQNDQSKSALKYLSTIKVDSNNVIKFKKEQCPMENPLEMLSLCFKFNDQELLQHLFDLSDMETSQKDIINDFLSPMIYLYNHAQKETFKTACKEFITQMYYFKQDPNVCVKENLFSAWKEINASYERGNALESRGTKQKLMGIIYLGISTMVLMTMPIAIPFSFLIPPLGILVTSMLLPLAILTSLWGAYFSATAERFDRPTHDCHENMKRAYPALTRFMSEVDSLNHDNPITTEQGFEPSQKLI